MPGLMPQDAHLDPGDTSDLNRILLDIGSHGHPCHQFAERGPEGLNIAPGVELAQPQVRIQLPPLFLAHEYLSRHGMTGHARPASRDANPV